MNPPNCLICHIKAHDIHLPRTQMQGTGEPCNTADSITTVIHSRFTLGPASPQVFSILKLNQPVEVFKGHGDKCYWNIFATVRTHCSISPRLCLHSSKVRQPCIIPITGSALLSSSPWTSPGMGRYKLTGRQPCLPPLLALSFRAGQIEVKVHGTSVSCSQSITNSTSSQVTPQFFALPS